ncbi:MAG: AraC family transcriptional regulator [Segetibacter sp.]|nr:AraC family transcriptional regulator [Segetibacter sp.]
MDKINTGNWGNTFSEVSLQQVFNNDRYHEAVISLHEPGLARANLRTIHTPGMDLIHAQFSTQRKLELADPENVASISSSYVLSGELESTFNYNNRLVRHKSDTHAFQYTPDFNGRHIIHDNKLEALSFIYNPDYFKSIANSSGVPFLDNVMNCIDRGEHLLVPPGEVVLQPRMAELAQQIVHCAFTGLTRYLFIEAKMLELFAMQMEQLNSDTSDKEKWSLADRERLKAAHDFIIQSYLEPLTLSCLCYKFGLNEFKLKKGYKHFFGTTVFGHILKLRMEAARELLVSGAMTVSEVAYHIGYSNVSSFSEAFKKHFGYLPRSVRNIHHYESEVAI